MTTKRNFKLMPGGKGKKTGGRKGNGGRRASGREGELPAGGPRISRSGRTALAVLAAFLCLAAGGLLFAANRFQVKNISVEGNLHYTREEIIDMVLTDRLSYNSLYLTLKYRNRRIEDIPFIQTMSVNVVSPDSIRIIVYEKTVAGYVEYMGRFMYFDRDGVVVESSETRTMGIPQVTGVKFDHVVLYEPLPVEDASIFQQILSITQMLSKYEITADKIYFNEDDSVTLYFGDVRVRLGSSDYEEKVMRLPYILPRLEGESGVLKLENYTEESGNITFERDEKNIPETPETEETEPTGETEETLEEKAAE